jgi:hypothetical protein
MAALTSSSEKAPRPVSLSNMPESFSDSPACILPTADCQPPVKQRQSRPGARCAAGRGPPISKDRSADRRGWNLTKSAFLGARGRNVKLGRGAYPPRLPLRSRAYIRPRTSGRNLIAAQAPRATKASSATAWVTTKGGSDCVGASGWINGSFMNACAIPTKTFR